MTDTHNILLKAIISKLEADTAVTNIVGTKIYSDVPQDTAFPYVSMNLISTDYSTKDSAGMEHILDVHVFSNKKSPEEAGNARAAIINSLNRSESTITLSSGSIASINFLNGTILKDQDGVTWHGVSSFRTVII